MKRKNNGILSKLLLVFLAALSVIGASVAAPELLFSDENSTENSQFYDYPLHVSFIDVGQGDCSLYSCNGFNILVDGGEREYADDVLSYLDMAGVDKIDCYVLSHPHSDHIGASAKIIKSIQVDKVFTTYFSEFNTPTTSCYEELIEALDVNSTQVIDVAAGDSFTFGDVNIDIIAPFNESDEYNDMSIVFTAAYKDITVLFTGDTTKVVEKQILESGADIDADVLKVAHHGSTTSSSSEFIDAVSPSLAVISCGKNNSYGHPHDEIMELFKEKSISVKRTDELGTVVYYGDGKTMYTGELK